MTRPKDEHLPGMAPKTIPSVHRAIEEYVAARDARMDLTKVEVQKKALLMTVMKKHGITHYAVDGHVADLDTEETVKAKLEREDDAKHDEPKAPKKRRARGKDAAAGE